MVINVWKAKVDRSVNHECAMCGKMVKSILHRFQDFKNAQKAYEFTHGIFNDLFYDHNSTKNTTLMLLKHNSFTTMELEEI